MMLKKLLLLIVVNLMLYGLSDSLLAQTAAYDTANAAAAYDSIPVDPLKISEAGIVSVNKKTASLRIAKKQLQRAREEANVQAEATALLRVADAYLAHGNNNSAFINLEYALKLKDAFKDDKALAHLYYDLAIVLARQKQYAAAFKCFYKTGYVYQQTFFKRKRRQIFAVDTTAISHIGELFTNNIIEDSSALDIFSDAMVDHVILTTDTSGMPNNPVLEASPDIDYMDILNAFDDNKEAVAYGIMVHIKQPISGRDNIFTNRGKVGHTFITLTKFNADSTIVARTFGFYPEKDNLLSATPLLPSTNSVFKDDALHDWDEVIGKFISEKQFAKMLDFIEETGSNRYNLNHNNCTDFGLHIAAIANLEIQDTKGYWPLGRGNTPASTGQSILKGKFKNIDNNSQHGLFACSNNLFIKRAVQ